MSKILVIDDTKFWRDIAADALRGSGHIVFTAADGMEGLTSLRSNGADLIVLDVEMPRLTGLSFLDQLRRDSRWKSLPVIMLTGDGQKDDILRAKKLGAVDYLLKSRFDIPNLLDRVGKKLGTPPATQTAASQTTPPRTMPGEARMAAPPAPTSDSGLLTRDQSLDRLERAMQGRTLCGIAAQVIAAARAPRMDLADLAEIIGRDPVLTAQVLQTANSAAYASSRGAIATLAEAVRVIGSSAVRDIAVSVGVFDAMPTGENDGFDPIQCWQHSLAVAMLCKHLANEEQRGLAYLAGLCHNLGEILFRTHFGSEYRKVVEASKATGAPASNWSAGCSESPGESLSKKSSSGWICRQSFAAPSSLTITPIASAPRPQSRWLGCSFSRTNMRRR